MRLDPNGKIEGELAESWRNPNDTTWEYKLRTGVKFHNGEPFNATVAKYSIDWVLDPANKSAAAELISPTIAKVNVLGDSTLQIITKTPSPVLDTALLWIPMIPQKASTDNPSLLDSQAIGTGPMKLVEWKKDDRLVLQRNADYWGPKVSVERITYRIIPDDSTRVLALQAGEVQLITAVPPDQIPTIQKNANAMVDARGQRMVYIGLDQLGNNAPPFKDKRVRQAVNYAVNKDVIVKDIFQGFAVLNVAGQYPQAPGYDPNLKPYPYDPAKAKQLLSEAGFPNGFAVTLSAAPGLDGAQKVQEVVESVASDLAKVGINTKLDIMEAVRMEDLYSQAKFQMYLFSYGGSPASGLPYQHLLQSDVRGYYYKNPETDKLIAAYFGTLDPAKRAAAGTALQRHVYDEAPFLFLYQQRNLYAMSKALNWASREDYIIHPVDFSWRS